MATLGSQAVGSIVKLNVNGTARNFIVVNQGLPGSMYDSSCDGTWLLMENILEIKQWDSEKNDYANSDVHSYLNSAFINLFDEDIKSAIKQVKIPYTKDAGQSGTLATGTNGLSTMGFLLSYSEVGFSGYSSVNAEGTVLNYFNGASASKRVAEFNGDGTSWWLRSPRTKPYGAYVYTVDEYGYADDGTYAGRAGVRPALVLPTDTNVADDGTIGLASGAITGSLNIGGVERELTGKGYININGVLRELSDSRVNIGGTIESLKG